MLQLESPVQRIRFVKELRYDPEACNRSVPPLWSVASLARPKGSPPLGALPRLRGRRGRHHPWSVASHARPKGSPPLERCLACEAVVSKGKIVTYAQFSQRPASRLFGFHARAQRVDALYFLPAQTSCAIPWPANTRSTASTTSETEIRFIQRKSIGHSRRKQGLHST